jgi:DNA-binding MarR family transcriptional regulator
MHPLLFSFKRVFLCSARLAADLAKEFDLTPARYDLLIAIARSPDGIAQMRLPHIIGVTRPVICRMLYKLEELGLVWRHPHPDNDRWRWVRLTELGLTRYTIANTELMGPESVPDSLVHSMVTQTPQDFSAQRRGYLAAAAVTDIVRDRLGDRASLSYPLYPPPCAPWPTPFLPQGAGPLVDWTSPE